MGSRFRHAVASFEPTESGVLIWTRLTGATELSWAVAADPDFHDLVADGNATTGPERDYTVTVDVGDLRPATTYWYRFESAAEKSPVGRTRTLPAAPASGIRIGLTCCAHYSVSAFGVYRALAEREVDFVLHLGDYIYEDDGASGPREHDPPHMAVTLDDYRRRMAQHRLDADCQALHLRHPMILVVDDHDVADNCWKEGAKAHDADRHGPWRDRAWAATQARQEWVPARLRNPDDPTSTWRAVEIADLADLVMLDTRLSGRDLQAGEKGAKRLSDPDRSLLGDAQRSWMNRRLLDNARPWTILVSGVVVNEVTLPLPATSAVNPLLPGGYAALEGKVLHDDQWDGYPAERDRLVEVLGRRGAAGGRTVILSGDVHSSWAFEGPKSGDDRPVAVEFTTPAVSSKPMGRSHLPGAWRLLDGVVRLLEHVPWVDVSQRGYGVLNVTRERAHMEWWHIEATDQQPQTAATPARTFETEHAAWPPRLVPADPERDPARPGLPEPLPGRPPDLARIRAAHRRRQILARTAGTAMPIVAAFLASPKLRAGLMRGLSRVRIASTRPSGREHG